MRALLASCSLLFAGFLACSSSQSTPSDAGTPGDDAGADAVDEEPTDAGNGAPSDVYPAFTPQLPQVIDVDGGVVAHAKIVPAYFANDALEQNLNDYIAAFAPSSHWKEMIGEYGAMDAVAEPAVAIADAPPTSIDDAAIKTWLATMLDGSHPEWPAPDDSTIYVLFYPKTTSITFDGNTSCKQFGGYHTDMALPSQQKVAYAVIPRCASSIASLGPVVSHELVEAATDPHPYLDPAYAALDPRHMAWMATQAGGEVGDMCQLDPKANYAPPDMNGLLLQRSWSNTKAAALHDPCVPPIPNQVYFAAAPVLPDTVTVTIPALPMFGMLGGQTIHVDGVKIPMGQSRVVDLQMFSDGPTSGPWLVTATDTLQSMGLAGQTLAFALDRKNGTNGEVLHLTITATGKSILGVSVFEVTSRLGSQAYSWTGTVDMN